MTNPIRGGRRPNAGRPRIFEAPVQRVSFSLDAETRIRLRLIAEHYRISQSGAIRELVARFWEEDAEEKSPGESERTEENGSAERKEPGAMLS